MAKLTKTKEPGIYRKHVKSCAGMGRCDCSYVVVSHHRGKQVKTTCRTMTEAREVKGEYATGGGRPTAKIRFATYFEGWIKTYSGRTSRGLAESTREEYRRVLKADAVPAWGTWKLSDLEPSDVRSLFVEMREDDRSTPEIKKLRVALSTMYSTAVEDGVLRSNPIQGVRIPAGPAAEEDDQVKAMTREELGLILAAFPDEHRLFFEFLTHTGLRISEAVGLTWDHLDLGGKSPKVKIREQVYRGKRSRLKTRASRRDLPLSPAMAERLLARRRDHYEGPDAPVFPSPGKLRRTEAGLRFPFSPQNFGRSVLHPARKAVGLNWVTFHTFRHTCASLLFEEDRNIKQVSEWLGHTDPSFTLRRYVHLMDGGIGDAAFLDAIVVPAGATSGQQDARKLPKVETSANTPESAA